MAYFGRKKEVVNKYYELLEEYLDIRMKYSNSRSNKGNNIKEYICALGEAILECILAKYSYYEINAVLNSTSDYKYELGNHYYLKSTSYSHYNFGGLGFLPNSCDGFNSSKVNSKFNEVISVHNSLNNSTNNYESNKNEMWQRVLDYEEFMKSEHGFNFNSLFQLRNEYIREYEKKNNVKTGMII